MGYRFFPLSAMLKIRVIEPCIFLSSKEPSTFQQLFLCVFFLFCPSSWLDHHSLLVTFSRGMCKIPFLCCNTYIPCGTLKLSLWCCTGIFHFLDVANTNDVAFVADMEIVIAGCWLLAFILFWNYAEFSSIRGQPYSFPLFWCQCPGN